MNNILTKLEHSGVNFTIHRHDPVFTMHDVNEKLSFPPEATLKTLVFKIKDSVWVLAVLRASDKIDYRLLATALGVSRTGLTKPNTEEIEKELGLEIGGISPLSTSPNTRVLFDLAVLKLDKVFCGVGTSDQTLEIDVRDLVQLSKGVLHQLARE